MKCNKEKENSKKTGRTQKRHPKLKGRKPEKRPEKVNRQSERPSAREKREKPRNDGAKSGRNYTLPRILACPELDCLLLLLH